MGIREALPVGNAVTHYGTREVETLLPTQYDTKNGLTVQEINFSFDSLPTASASDQAVLTIPANAYIESATLRVLEVFTGGTSYDIGLQETDGTEIDDDGLFDGTLLAALNVVGETTVGAGTLITLAAGIGTAAGQVIVVETGTFTAGRAVLEVVYRSLDDRSSF